MPPSLPSLPPTIEFDTLRLREMRPSDAEALWSYFSDPRVIEHTSIPEPTREWVDNRIEICRQGYADGTRCVWVLAGQADDVAIGTCGFTSWSLDHGWAEMAYDLAPSRWGAGLMTQAVGRAVSWAFGECGFRRVQALVMTSNERSAKLLDRLGFRREGTLRAFRLARGIPRDFDMYALLRSEWSDPA